MIQALGIVSPDERGGFKWAAYAYGVVIRRGVPMSYKTRHGAGKAMERYLAQLGIRLSQCFGWDGFSRRNP